MSAGKAADLEMTPPMVAEQMGWSRFRAYREMLAIEKAYPGVIKRKGKTLTGPASKLAQYIRGLRPSPLEREVTLLRTALSEAQSRIDAEARARVAFQELAHRWFARVASLEKTGGYVRASKKDSP